LWIQSTQGIAQSSHVQLLKVSKALHNNLALTKFLNPHKLWHGFQKLMHILILSYLKVSKKLPIVNPPLWTNNNSSINSLQSTIIFKTLWKLIILLLLQWYWCGGRWRTYLLHPMFYNTFWFSIIKRIWACLMCKHLSKCLHMGAWKDYLKLSILLSPN